MLNIFTGLKKRTRRLSKKGPICENRIWITYIYIYTHSSPWPGAYGLGGLPLHHARHEDVRGLYMNMNRCLFAV